MDNFSSFVCPICGNSDTRYIGFRKGKPYCRKCITFRGQELKKYRLVVSDEIKIDVYVSLIKEQRKNGGKLTNEALTQKGRTPFTSIKSKHKKKGKKNGKL